MELSIIFILHDIEKTASSFGRRQCNDCQSMDLGRHHVVDRIIHQSMSHDEFEPLELAANDAQIVVPATEGGAGMAGMARGVILDYEFLRRQCRLHATADALDARLGSVAHASSLMYFDKNMVCPMMNTMKIPVMPNSLKLTQAAVSALKMTKATNRLSKPRNTKNEAHA